MPYQLRPNLWIQFRPKYMTGDNPNVRKQFGNQPSGHFCCQYCTCNFDNAKELLEYNSQVSVVAKTLQSVLQEAKKGKHQKGITRLPGILEDDVNISLQDQNLQDYQLGFDNLHNGGGAGSHVYELLSQDTGFDKIKANKKALGKLYYVIILIILRDH
jgi:hypothetical protein